MTAAVLGTIGILAGLAGLVAGVFAGRCERCRPLHGVTDGGCDRCRRPAAGIFVEELPWGRRRERLCRRHLEERLQRQEEEW